MLSLGVIVALGHIACTYTAPESTPLLDDLVTALHKSNPEYGTEEIKTVLEDIREEIEAKGADGAKKSIKDLLQSVSKSGQLDKGFVSDLINSTLSGVQMGISVGNKNGTTNQLCIKLGNVALGGCRRTAPHLKEISSDNNRTQILTELDDISVE